VAHQAGAQVKPELNASGADAAKCMKCALREAL
jgi:hypothetical protein